MPKRLLFASIVLVAAVIAALFWSGATGGRGSSRAAPARAEAEVPRDIKAPADAQSVAKLIGRVVEDGTDNSVAGATVTAYAFGSGRLLTAATAEDGTFDLSEPQGEAFHLVARHAGFGAASARVVGPVTPIFLRLPQAGGIRGSVVATDGGSPVPDCRVSATRLPDASERDTPERLLLQLIPPDLRMDAAATTDIDGTFEMKGLAPGIYTFLIEPRDLSPVPNPPHTGLYEVEVRAHEVARMRIRAASNSEKLVEVFDQDTGQPLDGVRFEAQAPGCSSVYVPLAATERSAGAYGLRTGAARGRFQEMRLRVSRDGYARRVLDFPRYDPLPGAIAGPFERKQFHVALGRAATIDGHVRLSGEAVPGAILVVTTCNDDALAKVTAGPDGEFGIQGLDPGDLEIHVFSPSLDPIAVVALVLKSGERNTIEIGAAGTAAIEGRVVVAGKPEASARVTLAGAAHVGTATGRDDEYRFEGLGAGRHELTVTMTDGGSFRREVEITEGQRARLDIDAACTVEGVVIDAQSGEAVTNAAFHVTAQRVGSEDHALAYAGEDGRFRLHVAAGRYRIDGNGAGVYAVEQPLVEATRATVPEVTMRVARRTRACRITLDLRDERTGESVANGAFEYQNAGNSGRTGQDVWSTRGGSEPLTLAAPSPGVYRIRVWSDAHVPSEVEVRIDAGQEEARETVTLRRAEAVRVEWVGRDDEAARAGLRSGDLILACNGIATPSIAALDAAIGEAQDPVRIDFEQNGVPKVATVTTDGLPALENILLGR